MSGYNIDIADMQCSVFRRLNPSGKCLPATALSLILTQRFGKKALIC